METLRAGGVCNVDEHSKSRVHCSVIYTIYMVNLVKQRDEKRTKTEEEEKKVVEKYALRGYDK